MTANWTTLDTPAGPFTAATTVPAISELRRASSA